MGDVNKRVDGGCRMPCNQGLIPAFRSTDRDVVCPENACPYNKYGKRFNKWSVEVPELGGGSGTF